MGSVTAIKRSFYCRAISEISPTLKKTSACHPYFSRKRSKVGLWLDNLCKQSWLDHRVAVLDTQLQTVKRSTASRSVRTAPQDVREIEILCKEGFLDKALAALHLLDKREVVASVRTYRNLLQACMKRKALAEAKQVHAHLLKNGLESNRLLGDLVVTTLVHCGSLADGLQLFGRLSHRSVYCWTAVISGYNNTGLCQEALSCYDQMKKEGVDPNNYTFVSLLKACSKLEDLEAGKRIHADAVEHGFGSDIFICSTLISMYAKCGMIEEARQVFDGLSQRNVVVWNAMLAAYAQVENGETALRTYRQMQEEGVRPTARTLVSALQACSLEAEKECSALVNGQTVKASSLRQGKTLHSEAVSLGLETDMFVGSSLVSMYAKCGSIKDAEDIFAHLSQQDVVSWTAMITAYAQQERGDKALQLYAEMQAQGVRPDEGTFISVLEACSSTGAIDVCKGIHQSIMGRGWQASSSLATSLIYAYGKCGSMVDARSVFDSMPRPDVAACNALLAGYARVGACELSMQCYEDMCLAGMTPNAVTFLSLLSSCSHAGEVDKGLEYFENMSRLHGICAGLEHYACVIDLVGRAGLFSKAEELLACMPMQPDLPVWLCLLGACRKHGNVIVGERAFDGAVRLDREHAAAYVLMSNIYADAGLWNSAREVDELRQNAVNWKKPGRSWIEHGQEVHSFEVGDKRHKQEAELSKFLKALSVELKDSRNYL